MKRLFALLTTMAVLFGIAAAPSPVLADPGSGFDVIWGAPAVAPVQSKAALDPSWLGCDSNEICGWRFSDGVQFIAGRAAATARNTCLFNDNDTTSVWNITSYRWFYFRDSQCAGAHIEVPPGSMIGALHVTYGSGWDGPTRIMRTSYTS